MKVLEFDFESDTIHETQKPVKLFYVPVDGELL